MAVARFRRTKRRRRGGQRTIDDRERGLQRDSSENRVPGNGSFLSTGNRSPKSFGEPKRAGSGANGGGSRSSASRQWSRDQARAAPGTTTDCAVGVRR